MTRSSFAVPETPLDISNVPELFEKRQLNDNNNNGYSSVYVDSAGNEYEPYSMGWRYLGMYLDCDVSEYGTDDMIQYHDDGIERRNLNSGSGSGDAECARKLLWAAYVDPRYQGGSIGEYQYFDPYTNTWDDTSCQTGRCAKMDCHDPHTHFKLIGVYKESDGLYDWGEQLFKHHGYCQWDEDTYETMQDLIEDWPQDGCKKLEYSDSYGNTLYSATKPLPEGNLTVGLYYNEQCTQDSGLLWSDYIVIYYTNYYYYYYYQSQGESKAKKWLQKMKTWNDAMAIYKICQPCRAYSLNQDGSGSGSGSGDRRLLAEENLDQQRQLGNEDNDGGGDAEQWGYDCEDDAGYTNCNQCYKFETHTTMVAAEKADLLLASSQGTLLSIRVNYTSYGRGGYRSAELYPIQYVEMAGKAVGVLIVAAFVVWKCFQCRKRKVSRSLQEKLTTAMDYTSNCALAGIECEIAVRDQKPTRRDPQATDIIRFPRFRNNARALADDDTVQSKDASEVDSSDDDESKDASLSVKNETSFDEGVGSFSVKNENSFDEGVGIEQCYVSMDENGGRRYLSLDEGDRLAKEQTSFDVEKLSIEQCYVSMDEQGERRYMSMDEGDRRKDARKDP